MDVTFGRFGWGAMMKLLVIAVVAVALALLALAGVADARGGGGGGGQGWGGGGGGGQGGGRPRLRLLANPADRAAMRQCMQSYKGHRGGIKRADKPAMVDTCFVQATGHYPQMTTPTSH
jgi:Spy/CpxP family protein refolding chaperone